MECTHVRLLFHCYGVFADYLLDTYCSGFGGVFGVSSFFQARLLLFPTLFEWYQSNFWHFGFHKWFILHSGWQFVVLLDT